MREHFQAFKESLTGNSLFLILVKQSITWHLSRPELSTSLRCLLATMKFFFCPRQNDHMLVLHSRMSQSTLSSRKGHQIASWKPRNHRQTAARGRWFRDNALWGWPDTTRGTHKNDKWVGVRDLRHSPSFICKWAQHDCPLFGSFHPPETERQSKLPIKADKMADEMIVSDGKPDDAWHHETRRGEMS